MSHTGHYKCRCSALVTPVRFICLSSLRMPVALFSKLSTGHSETDTSRVAFDTSTPATDYHRSDLHVYHTVVLHTCRCGPRALVSVRSHKYGERGALLLSGAAKIHSLLTKSLTTRPSHPPHKLSRLQVKYNIQVSFFR